VPQRSYGPLACYLAEHGFAVVTYDYRDMGASRRGPAKDSAATVSVWGRKDQSAVLAWARSQFPSIRLLVLGHSMGGWLLGFTERTADIDGVLLLAAHSTYVGHWDGASGWKVRALWKLGLPLVNRALGYVPGWTFGGEDVPPGCAAEGTRWASRESFIGEDERVTDNLASLRCPVRAYSFADDTFYAPRSAVVAFLAQLSRAQVEHRHVAPADYGLGRIGHFGCLAPRSRPLWEELCEVLGSLGTASVESGAPPSKPRAHNGTEDAKHDRTGIFPKLAVALRTRAKLTLRDVFCDLVRFTRDIDAKMPLTEDVRYRISHDPVFGELPIVKPPLPMTVRALPLLARWNAASTTAGPECYASAAEAHEDAVRTFGGLVDSEHFDCREEHLSDAWLHHMMVTKYSLWLEPEPASSRAGKQSYAFDLEAMQEVEEAPGYERHGGKIVLDDERILHITHHGRDYFPGDAEWELVKYKVRASGFAWITLLHSVLHVREAAKLFTATYRFLPRTHPLHTMLLPYVYGTHRNVARLQRTVTGTRGATAAVGGFRSGPEALEFVAKRVDLRLCPEYAVQWTEHYRDVRALWDLVHLHVAEYVALHRLDAGADPAVEQWLTYLGQQVHPRLYTSNLSPSSDLGLVDVLTYLIYSVSILHYAMGHIMNGTTDPRYVCASVRKSDTRDLWSVVSSRDECLVRLAVYASVNRHGYRLTDDFSGLITDTRGKAIVRGLAHSMQQRSAAMEAENLDRVRPRLIVPSAIYSSAAQ